LDTRIKSYADAIYDRSMMKSVADYSSAKVAYLNERAARNPAVYMPLGGTDIQALVRVSAEHIERCMASRLASYQEAYREASRVPTDQEFTEILNDFKGVRERELRNSSAAIGRLAISMGPTNHGNARGLLDSASARTHDLVLRDWKVWREQTRLQQSAKEPAPEPDEKPKQDGGALEWITEGLWRWEVIGIGFPALYGAGIAAMYGDDYWVAAALYASGISWPAAKIIVSEETKAHGKRATLRLFVLLSSLLILAMSFLWISHRRKQHLAETPVVVSPLKAQSISPPRQAADQQPTSPKPATPGPEAPKQEPDGHRRKPTAAHDDQGDAVTQTVVDLISEQLRVDPAKVVPSARLKEDLGADQLDKLELEMGIEGAFDIRIEAADWIHVRTVQDMDNYVHAHFKGAKKETSD
jgi:acyl carrier protein